MSSMKDFYHDEISNDSPVCTCCESSPAHPLCGDHCEKCHRPCLCSSCDRDLENDQIEGWEPGDSTQIICDFCKMSENKHLWVEATCIKVKQLASEHGWTIDRWTIAETGSRYTELFKECSSCLGVICGDCECNTVKIRVSDHATAYCSEDFSIAMKPNLDDHTVNDLEKFLESKNSKEGK